jgi:hypothetical protein
MTDLAFEQFSTVQSNLQPTNPTIASAATIAPTTLITYLTGTVQLATITPPVSGTHMLVLIFTNGAPGALLTTGNIKRAVTPVTNVPVLMFYDTISALYWPANCS